jgi:CelD/BcsL family acetyltransferase involved in cellulose biosynthesis
VLRELREPLDHLHASVGAPVTARRTWLQVWLDTHTGYEPFVVGLHTPEGALAAVALLATSKRAGVTRVVPMGHGTSDVVTMSALDDRYAEALASLVAEHLRTVRPWNLTARHTSQLDPVVPHLIQRLRHAQLLDGDVSPVMRATQGDSLNAYVSSSHRKGGNWLRNRLRREGVALDVAHLADPAEVAEALPEVEDVHRLRDHQLGRDSPMDSPEGLTFFRELVLRHAERDEVRLTTLRLGGALAAYALCFADGDTYRMWNCRFDPEFAPHSPGKLAIDEAIAQALRDGVKTYDFMRGDEPYKRGYSNDENYTKDLRASSNVVFATSDRCAIMVRDRVRRMEATGGRPARVAAVVRKLAGRVS